MIDEAQPPRGARAAGPGAPCRAAIARAHAFRETGAPRTAAWASALAAGVAGREAAWSCAGAAAWAAARIAVGDMAGRPGAGRRARRRRRCGGDRGRESVRTAHGSAATGPARSAGATLGDLADSAIALLDRMLPTETVAIPALAHGLGGRLHNICIAAPAFCTGP